MKDVGTTWTDDRVELLKRLWADGLSASRIANEMGGGITRNAVIGKVHRLGLSGRDKKKGSTTPRPRKKSAEKHPSLSFEKNPQPKIKTEAEKARKPVERQNFSYDYHSLPPSEMPDCKRVTIMELNDSMCRWPLGDPVSPDFRFCGGDALTGLPYCPYHCAMAYQPASERRKDRKTA